MSSQHLGADEASDADAFLQKEMNDQRQKSRLQHRKVFTKELVSSLSSVLRNFISTTDQL